jgi:hypothetical protein
LVTTYETMLCNSLVHNLNTHHNEDLKFCSSTQDIKLYN